MAINEYEIKKQICDIGKRIYDRNMVAANDGNIPDRCFQRFHDSGVHL